MTRDQPVRIKGGPDMNWVEFEAQAINQDRSTRYSCGEIFGVSSGVPSYDRSGYIFQVQDRSEGGGLCWHVVHLGSARGSLWVAPF